MLPSVILSQFRIHNCQIPSYSIIIRFKKLEAAQLSVCFPRLLCFKKISWMLTESTSYNSSCNAVSVGCSMMVYVAKNSLFQKTIRFFLTIFEKERNALFTCNFFLQLWYRFITWYFLKSSVDEESKLNSKVYFAKKIFTSQISSFRYQTWEFCQTIGGLYSETRGMLQDYRGRGSV